MFLHIDKPKGITSHDVVDRVRRITGTRKVGHAGTLDPNATGLLIIGIDRESTKKLGQLTVKTDKTYIAEITFGEERDTDDAEGKVVNKTRLDKPISQEEIETKLEVFTGEQMQTPPTYSAVKMGGKKSYELARKSMDITIEPRKIIVYEASLISYAYPKLTVEFVVSSGTYIRALARDIGREVGAYAYLSNLKRTKIGKYSLDHAVNLDTLTSANWKEYAVEL